MSLLLNLSAVDMWTLCQMTPLLCPSVSLSLERGGVFLVGAGMAGSGDDSKDNITYGHAPPPPPPPPKKKEGKCRNDNIFAIFIYSFALTVQTRMGNFPHIGHE